MRGPCLCFDDQPRSRAAYTQGSGGRVALDEALGAARYVQYVNRAYRRSGTLWQGRFRSCIAQEEEYILACQRYIELNPVRAGMVTHPRHYRWSSYRINAEGKASALLTPHAQYLALGSTDEARRESYRQLFRGELDPEVVQEIRDATNGNFALGGERFKREIEMVLGRATR